MPPRIVRYGSAFDLNQFDVLCFDLDHTIARYRVPALMKLIYECLRNALIAEFGYPVESLSKAYDANIFQKGIIADFVTGDVLKLDVTGRVTAAFHGTKRLTCEEVIAKYGGEPWAGFEMLHARQRHDAFFVLLTYFDGPCVGLFMQLVDHLDATAKLPILDVSPKSYHGAIAVPYMQIKTDLIKSFDFIFDNVAAFQSGRGGFFSAIKANPSEYLAPRPTLTRKLLEIREAAQHVLVLVTNSHIHFAEWTMQQCLGDDWRKCFDIVIFNSSKPGFFAKQTDLHAVDLAAGLDSERLLSWNVPFSYQQSAHPLAALAARGNASLLQRILDREKELRIARLQSPDRVNPIYVDVKFTADGKLVDIEEVSNLAASDADDRSVAVSPDVSESARAPQTLSVTDSLAGTPDVATPDISAESVLRAQKAHTRNSPGRAEVIYFGDHIHGDVVPAVIDAKWSAVSVVEELECSTPFVQELHASGHVMTLNSGLEDNFCEENDGSCYWGDFFRASSAADAGPSYFSSLLSKYSVMAMTDVELSLATLVK